MPTDGFPVLECRNVSAGGASDGGSRVVFAGASFSVDRGDRLVVLGGSGAGKSTLLRLLNRLDEPLAGTILFHGRLLTELEPTALRRKVALVLQTPVMFEGTVGDNLRVRPRGTPEPDRARLLQLLADVGLDADFFDRPASALSVGEQQRVSFARSLVSEPEVLLLDEPTSALDPRSLARVADLVLSLAERHALAVIAATHQAELAGRLGGKTLLIADGHVRSDVAEDDVRAFFQAS
jgi:putative ABC transport system ATP-binding protein